MSMAMSRLDIMVRAMCDADGIDASLLGSKAEDQMPSISSPVNTFDISMVSDDNAEVKESSA